MFTTQCGYALALVLIMSPTAEQIRRIAGGGETAAGSPADRAVLKSPFGLVEAPDGSIVFVEMTGHRVRSIAPNGAITTIAGTGEEGFAGDGGPAKDAKFKGMHALAVAKNGDLYIADTWNNRIRRIDARTGKIETFAGTGEKGFSGDNGPAKEARFGGIYSLALTFDGSTMYVADLDNRRVREIDMRTGIVNTSAGDGRKGVPADGDFAPKAPLVDPRAVAVDHEGNLYILERGGHALRVVDRAGKIRTIVGTGKPGYSGDGGPARVATLNGPKDLAVEDSGNILIADTENHVIRRYRPETGTINRVAGTGSKGSSGLDGSPLAAELNQPHGVWVDRSGAILISDSSNHRILKISNP